MIKSAKKHAGNLKASNLQSAIGWELKRKLFGANFCIEEFCHLKILNGDTNSKAFDLEESKK